MKQAKRWMLSCGTALAAMVMLAGPARADTWSGFKTIQWIKVRGGSVQVALNGVSSSSCGYSSKPIVVGGSAIDRMTSALIAARLAAIPVSIAYDGSCNATVVEIND